jgi:monofunctional biosynthetic peptidoglycan transglycosylase
LARILAVLIAVPHLYAAALRFIPVPYTTTMAARAISGEDVRRDWTRLEDISPHLIRAVIGAEDSRYCEHWGIDIEATREVLDADGAPRRGASTLTQQAAKNVFFWQGGGYIRKAGEAWMAGVVDFIWGKRRTLEIYLNVAEWGDGLFGAEAAAQARFGKPASDLSAREAALLAAVLPSPNKWRVDPPGPYVQERATTLQSRAAVIDNEGFADCVLN